MIKDIILYGAPSLCTILFSIVTYFIIRLIYKNDEQHTIFTNNINDIEGSIQKKYDEMSKEVSGELKEQRKKILELKEVVITVDAKQERLNIFARQIEEIHRAVDRKTDMDTELEEKINSQKKEVELIKKSLEEEVPKINYDHILESEFLSDAEKNSIKEHIEFLRHAPLHGYKINPFIKFIEDKIERKKFSMIKISDKWRVSDTLLNELKEKK